jgi:hypothetical protein
MTPMMKVAAFWYYYLEARKWGRCTRREAWREAWICRDIEPGE